MDGMTPEEAEHFYEEDEDPAPIFAALDAARKDSPSSHAPEAGQQLQRAENFMTFVPPGEAAAAGFAAGLYGAIQRDLLPAAGWSVSVGTVQGAQAVPQL